MTIVAVTKGFGPEAVSAAKDAGLLDVGENYAGELVDKCEAARTLPGAELRWHFLGAIQRNKVARLAPLVSCWQAVARVEEAQAIGRRSPGAAVLVEVETTGGATRNGCPPEQVPALVRSLADLPVEVTGLMTVAPPDKAGAKGAFRRVAALADELSLPVRSMGMSDDFELAVAEGSTMVRLGRVLFGERPPRQRRG